MLPVTASVVTKGELVQVSLDVLAIYPMVRTPQPSLQIADNPVDPGQDFSGAFRSPLDFGTMPVAGALDSRVTAPVVCVELAAGSDILPDERMEGVAGSVGNGAQADSARMVSPVFHGNDNGNFLSYPAAHNSLPDLCSSDVGFIHLNHPSQWLPGGINHGTPQATAQVKRGPVRTEAQVSLELQGGNSGAHRAHQICRPKPMAQWKMAAVQCGACGEADISPTSAASQPPRTHIPPLPMAAPGTFEAIGPAHLDQIFTARAIRGKTPLEFPDGSRENGVTLGREFLAHLLALLSKLVVPSA
jgi:hypothetical protein